MVMSVLNSNLSGKQMGSFIAFTSVRLQSWLEQAMDLASNLMGDTEEIVKRHLTGSPNMPD